MNFLKVINCISFNPENLTEVFDKCSTDDVSVFWAITGSSTD